MAKIDFSNIENLLQSSDQFSLTETQYKKLTGRALPKDHSYIIRKSALARFAAEHGFKIAVCEKTITFVK